MREDTRENTLHSKLHQALIDTINNHDTELVSKEEILEQLKEIMTEDFDEEEPEFNIVFKTVDSIISQFGSLLKDGENYYWAKDAYDPVYEDDEFNEVSYEKEVRSTSVKVRLTPEEIRACKEHRGGDWIDAEATVYRDGVVVIDWGVYIGYGDCFIPERLVGPVKQDDDSDSYDEVNELDLDF